MGFLVDKLLQEMLDHKECMTECREYKENSSKGRITKKCQACPHFPVVFKKMKKKLEEEIALK